MMLSQKYLLAKPSMPVGAATLPRIPVQTMHATVGWSERQCSTVQAMHACQCQHVHMHSSVRTQAAAKEQSDGVPW